MATSPSSSSFASSFASSSSLSHPPSYGRSYTSPTTSSWSHASGQLSSTTVSDVQGTRRSPGLQTLSSQTLDIGPPGYNATITLYPETVDERTVYLGPWQIVGSEPQRIIWQCSYQNEVLEHYLPSQNPLDFHPHTLHSRHRGFNDPSDMERHLTFNEPHRIRYTNDEGVCTHDCAIIPKYEFVSVASSIQFQEDLRRKQLVSFYDIDVVWTDKHSRTDAFGNVKGIGAIQRLKLWRDKYTAIHSLTILANKTDRQYHEYYVHFFEGELRREDPHRRARLNVNTRRGSGSGDSSSSLAFLAHRIRPGSRSSRQASRTRSDPAGLPAQPSSIDLRHLDFQFTNKEGYHQFLADWARAYSSDRNLDNIPSSRDNAGMPPPDAGPGSMTENDSTVGAEQQAGPRTSEASSG